MKVFLKDVRTGKVVEGLIVESNRNDMPLKKEKWNFDWRDLAKSDASLFYRVVTLNEPERIEGLLMLTLHYGEMVFMNNVEVAPRNFGSGGRFKNVAGILISFACLKSFELGKNNYRGFLSFESKTVLMKLYRDKYGAIPAMGQRMFIDEAGGKLLMQNYLNINTE